MKQAVGAILVLLLSPLHIAAAAGLGAPALSPPIYVERFFDPDRLLTTGGVKYSATDYFTLEPELGLGYRELEREIPGGIEGSRHQLHAQAGWRLSLARTLHVSAAAKLPVLSVESTERSTGQTLGLRYGYEFTRPFRNTITWTGEIGLHLSSDTDLSLYYDQSPLAEWWAGGRQQEERIGTRIIWRFW